MKVVATRSFFGSGVTAKKGVVISVPNKLAKAWLEAGLVVKADSSAEANLVATTSPKKATPKRDADLDTTGEVVDDQTNTDGSEPAVGEADKEPTTGDGEQSTDEPPKTDETGTETTEPTEPQAPQAPVAPATEPQAPVAPQTNSNPNTKKGK